MKYTIFGNMLHLLLLAKRVPDEFNKTSLGLFMGSMAYTELSLPLNVVVHVL